MQFMIKAYDGPNMLEKRLAVRPRHLEGMKKLGKRIICAGGLLDEEGVSPGAGIRIPRSPGRVPCFRTLCDGRRLGKGRSRDDECGPRERGENTVE